MIPGNNEDEDEDEAKDEYEDKKDDEDENENEDGMVKFLFCFCNSSIAFDVVVQRSERRNKSSPELGSQWRASPPRPGSVCRMADHRETRPRCRDLWQGAMSAARIAGCSALRLFSTGSHSN